MHVEKVSLQNVKCFADATLQLTCARGTGDRRNNWNVILGENGEGKSTLLRALAACLMDARTADRIVEPMGWIRKGAKKASLSANIVRDNDDALPVDDKGIADPQYRVKYSIVEGKQAPSDGYGSYPRATLVGPEEPRRSRSKRNQASSQPLPDVLHDIEVLTKSAFSREDHRGWLACGYGAFRRLPKPGTLFDDPTDPMEAKFVSLFDDNAALTRCEDWLKELDRMAAKSKAGSADRQRLKQVKARISNLLPNVTDIEIDEDVWFVFEKTSQRFRLQQMADGYRSMFALVVDILRRLSKAHQGTNQRVDEVSGVVLIDEIDAHLHPKWQREVGFLLTQQFPNLQFIVTTHSPFVAMAAGEGALSVLRQDGDAVRIDQDLPNPRGWAVDQVLTQIFGLESLRDRDTAKDLLDYQKLRLARGAGVLSAQDRRKLEGLEAKLGQIERQASPSGSFALDQDLDLIAKELEAKRLRS